MKQKNGTRIVFKTFSKPSVNRGNKPETRVYLMRRQERSTPLSENEIKQRNLFALASDFWKTMPTETKQIYRDIWSRDGYRFNGKVYVTLRGYVIARFIAEHKSN